MPESVLAAGCGSCDHVWQVRAPPAVCPECCADFGAGAPLLVIRLVLETGGTGGRLKIRAGYRPELRGRWDPATARKLRRAALRVVDGKDE